MKKNNGFCLLNFFLFVMFFYISFVSCEETGCAGVEKLVGLEAGFMGENGMKCNELDSNNNRLSFQEKGSKIDINGNSFENIQSGQ